MRYLEGRKVESELQERKEVAREGYMSRRQRVYEVRFLVERRHEDRNGDSDRETGPEQEK